MRKHTPRHGELLLAVGIAFLAVVATAAHTRRGNVRWRLAIPIAVAGIAGAALGAWIALSLDAEVLRRLFGVFLLVVAARMGWRTYRLSDQSVPEPDPF